MPLRRTILPVTQRPVAEDPIPLSQTRIAQSHIREELIAAAAPVPSNVWGCVVCTTVDYQERPIIRLQDCLLLHGDPSLPEHSSNVGQMNYIWHRDRCG